MLSLIVRTVLLGREMEEWILGVWGGDTGRIGRKYMKEELKREKEIVVAKKKSKNKSNVP